MIKSNAKTQPRRPFKYRVYSKVNDWARQFAYWCERRYSPEECDKLEAAAPDMPSKYELVGHAKFGMDHAILGSLFNEEITTIHSKKFQYADTAMFIAYVFCAQTGHSLNDIGIIYKPVLGEPDRYGNRYRVYTSASLIFTEETHKSFSTWFQAYKDRMPENYDFEHPIPVVKDGELLTGYFVNHGCSYRTRSSEDSDLVSSSSSAKAKPKHDHIKYIPGDDMVDEWMWMLNNTQGKVRVLGDRWVFEDASDAMMYQLQMK